MGATERHAGALEGPDGPGGQGGRSAGSDPGVRPTHALEPLGVILAEMERELRLLLREVQTQRHAVRVIRERWDRSIDGPAFDYLAD